jgi:hypothetical protein
VLSEVDRIGPLGIGLGRGDLAEGTEKAGQRCNAEGTRSAPRWCSLTISSRSKSSRRRVPMTLSQIAFGARNGIGSGTATMQDGQACLPVSNTYSRDGKSRSAFWVSRLSLRTYVAVATADLG